MVNFEENKIKALKGLQMSEQGWNKEAKRWNRNSSFIYVSITL